MHPNRTSELLVPLREYELWGDSGAVGVLPALPGTPLSSQQLRGSSWLPRDPSSSLLASTDVHMTPPPHAHIIKSNESKS